MLKRWIDRRVKLGSIRIAYPGGEVQYGSGDRGRPDLAIAVRLKTRKTLWKIMLRPDPYLGEAYVDGQMVIESGDLRTLLEFCFLNFRAEQVGRRLKWWTRLGRAVHRFLQSRETPRRARRHVSKHYDLSNAFYSLFLDDDMQYSCGYFPFSDTDLDQAQQAKKAHIMAKLLLRPGLRVLDIGCGWGGFGLSLAREAGCSVKGISLSQRQIALAQQRAAQDGLASRVDFVLEDYRETRGQFDRIVSVGMLEHVGFRSFDEYFSQVTRLLADDGVALIHAIGRMDEPGSTSPWIRRYIFPGGHVPSLSEVVRAVERAGLWITDIEILRLHYADTLKHWHERFSAHRDKASVMFDERFCRMWEFYLLSSELAFRYDGIMVFQVQLSRRIDAVPRTRDYLMDTVRSEDVATVIPFPSSSRENRLVRTTDVLR